MEVLESFKSYKTLFFSDGDSDNLEFYAFRINSISQIQTAK